MPPPKCKCLPEREEGIPFHKDRPLYATTQPLPEKLASTFKDMPLPARKQLHTSYHKYAGLVLSLKDVPSPTKTLLLALIQAPSLKYMATPKRTHTPPRTRPSHKDAPTPARIFGSVHLRV